MKFGVGRKFGRVGGKVPGGFGAKVGDDPGGHFFQFFRLVVNPGNEESGNFQMKVIFFAGEFGQGKEPTPEGALPAVGFWRETLKVNIGGVQVRAEKV